MLQVNFLNRSKFVYFNHFPLLILKISKQGREEPFLSTLFPPTLLIFTPLYSSFPLNSRTGNKVLCGV